MRRSVFIRSPCAMWEAALARRFELLLLTESHAAFAIRRAI